ncbi:MAG: hypothetical protein QF915_02270, partial [Candidatus Woesearchaeota archaeon]|nr:hypothetical protein [Candidatus Woesearchaeota archaeon]
LMGHADEEFDHTHFTMPSAWQLIRMAAQEEFRGMVATYLEEREEMDITLATNTLLDYRNDITYITHHVLVEMKGPDEEGITRGYAALNRTSGLHASDPRLIGMTLPISSDKIPFEGEPGEVTYERRIPLSHFCINFPQAYRDLFLPSTDAKRPKSRPLEGRNTQASASQTNTPDENYRPLHAALTFDRWGDVHVDFLDVSEWKYSRSVPVRYKQGEGVEVYVERLPDRETTHPYLGRGVFGLPTEWGHPVMGARRTSK